MTLSSKIFSSINLFQEVFKENPQNQWESLDLDKEKTNHRRYRTVTWKARKKHHLNWNLQDKKRKAVPSVTSGRTLEGYIHYREVYRHESAFKTRTEKNGRF